MSAGFWDTMQWIGEVAGGLLLLLVVGRFIYQHIQYVTSHGREGQNHWGCILISSGFILVLIVVILVLSEGVL